MTRAYIVELLNFGYELVCTNDLDTAISKAEKAGFEVALYEVEDGGELVSTWFYSPLRGCWERTYDREDTRLVFGRPFASKLVSA